MMTQAAENGSDYGKEVKITKISDTIVNPEPVKITEDAVLLDDFLSPRRLRALTGVEDLDQVTRLEMQVDTGEASLGNFGTHLPNLAQLKLSNSIIPSIRDLGSSLGNLRVLWMPQCCLENLDGVATMSRLRELYLSFNELTDVSPCGMLEQLEILDLEGNLIDDLHNIMYLSMCTQLRQLSLEGNPICTKPSADDEDTQPGYNYREEVLKMLPQLSSLDYISTSQQDPNPELRKAALHFDEHWTFINSLLKESGLVATSSDSLEAATTSSGIGSTLPSSHRPRTGLSTAASSLPPRPQSALRLASAQKRLMTARGSVGAANRPRSAVIRPGSAASNASSVDELLEQQSEESELTAGRVVCGSISKALRRRTPNAPAAAAAAGAAAAGAPPQRRPQTSSAAVTSLQRQQQLLLQRTIGA